MKTGRSPVLTEMRMLHTKNYVKQQRDTHNALSSRCQTCVQAQLYFVGSGLKGQDVVFRRPSGW